jgi:hypothetical protein
MVCPTVGEPLAFHQFSVSAIAMAMPQNHTDADATTPRRHDATTPRRHDAVFSAYSANLIWNECVNLYPA